MKDVKATLKTLRMFDTYIIRGKRMIVGVDYHDPCNHWGHEDVLAFVTTYVNDVTVREDAFIWDPWSVKHLEHICACPHCLARAFSTPDTKIAERGRVLLRAVS